MKAQLVVLSLLVVSGLACGGSDGPPDGSAPPDGSVGSASATLVRDRYGVPHVFASDRRAAAYAIGWAEAEDMRGSLLATLYGTTGRSSQTLGPSCGDVCVTADAFVHLLQVPETVERQYDALAPATREWLEAWAAGASAYFASASDPPPEWNPRDPPTGRMLAGLHLAFFIRHALEATQATLAPPMGDGSNQLAATGARTAEGTTLHLKDPHNLWGATEPYVHVHVEELDVVHNVAFGVMACGSSSALAFGCTRASPASAISIRADVRPLGTVPASGPCPEAPLYEHFDHAANGGSGGFVPFRMRCLELTAADGSPVGAWVPESRFGYVQAAGPDADGDGHPDHVFITHVFASHELGFLDYRVAAPFALTAGEYLALWEAPTPREDAQYRGFATRDHHVGLVLGASTPRLSADIDWTQPASSADPRIDTWTTSMDWFDGAGARFHRVGGSPELPHVVDPEGDFVQNCNGSARFATEPLNQIGDVPRYLQSAVIATVRDLRFREKLVDATALGIEDVIRIATDVEVTHARDLAEAAACGIASEGVDPVATWGDGGRLLEALIAWGDEGYAATPESTAATIMYLLEVRASPSHPASGSCLDRAALDVLAGTALADVAAYMRETYAARFSADPLSVPWGHVNFVAIGGREIGLPGMFANDVLTPYIAFMDFDVATGRTTNVVRGGSRVPQVTMYSDGTGYETWVTVPHGQIDETRFPSSPHIGQTIDDFAARRLRRMWLTREEVELNACPWGDPASAEHDPTHEHTSQTEIAVPAAP